MTARSSTGNFAKFGTYFLYKLRTLRPLIILTSIFSLLSYPMLAGFLVPFMHACEKTEKLRRQLYNSNFVYQSYYDNAEYAKLSETEDFLGGLCIMAVVICVIMLIAIFFMSFVTTRKNFRWLYNKTVVDMDYSLPISDDTRFFGDLASTATALFAPHLLAIGIGRLIFAFRPKGFEEELEEVLKSGIIDQALFSGLFACVMLMALVLFIISICGRKAETALYPLVLTVAIPVIHAVCLWLAYGDVYGYSFASTPSDFNSLSYTSPLGFLFMSLMYSVEFTGEVEKFAMPLFRPGLGIPAICVVLALLAGAYFLIKYRRAERVGQPFVYRIVKFIIPAVIIFTIVSPFMGVINELRKEDRYYNSYNPHYEGFIIAMVIVTFVVYVIMELISGKGFRKFHITLVKYLATMGISVLVCVGLWSAHGFGIENYVPDADEVQSVEFRINNYNVNHSYFRAEVSEEENIEAIVKMHEKYLDETDHEYKDENRHILVAYYLKNGEIVERDYDLTRGEYNEWLETVLTNEAYYYNAMEDWFFDYQGGTVTDIELTEYNLHYDVQFDGDKLMSAIKEDIYSASFDELYGGAMGTPTRMLIVTERKSGYDHHGYFDYCDWMTETRALLEDCGVYLGNLNSYYNIDKYPTRFLVEMPVENNWFNPVPAFIMTGDQSAYAQMLRDYGYSDSYVSYRVLSEEQQDEYEMYGYIESVSDVEVINYGAVELDRTMTEKVLMWAGGTELPITYTQDTAYALVLVKADNAFDFLTGDEGWEMQYIAEQYYDEAAELFAQLN